ncbi:MAG: hypothetical protein WD767_02175 [Alphaproteobacteria bacterium]
MTIRKFLTLCFAAALLGACGSLDSGAPSYNTVADTQARLFFDAPALSAAQARHRRAERAESGYRVERARWDAPSGVTAELMLIEALTPKGLDVPDDPKMEAANFPDLVRLKAAFGELYQSETAMGPSIWRRFVAGDRSCVIFSQRWDGGPGTPATRTLFGYYCAGPGDTFTLQDAQAVLLTAGIRAA